MPLTRVFPCLLKGGGPLGGGVPVSVAWERRTSCRPPPYAHLRARAPMGRPVPEPQRLSGAMRPRNPDGSAMRGVERTISKVMTFFSQWYRNTTEVRGKQKREAPKAACAGSAAPRMAAGRSVLALGPTASGLPVCWLLATARRGRAVQHGVAAVAEAAHVCPRAGSVCALGTVPVAADLNGAVALCCPFKHVEA